MKLYLIVFLILIIKLVVAFKLRSNDCKKENQYKSEDIATLEAYDDFKENDDMKDGVDFMKPSATGRFLSTHFHSAIFNLLKISPTHKYVTAGIRDVFDFLRDSYPLPTGFSGPLKEYDFVVVGAGAAGCVLSSRLSEGGRWTVLLLEAGGTESTFNQIPLLAPYLQHTHYNWGYRTERQEGLCLGMDDQQCHWPRGKAVGGSSTINYMIYTRGNKEDWDRIQRAGNPGWSYEDVLPYFLKSEKANLKGLERSPYHNKDGLMSVEDIPLRTPFVQTFLEAAVEMGNKLVDYNEANELGFSHIQAQMLKGKRHSAAKAFLYPFRNRRNLHILPHSRVTKININDITKTAESVEYVRNRIRYTVKVRNEIILSAGPISSPQLLMLSGIGPKEHLENVGIKIIKDLQVGQNMFDHVSYVGQIFLINNGTQPATREEIISLPNFIRWHKYGNGPLTLPGGVEGIGFIKTKISEEEGDYPDVELLMAGGSIASDPSQIARKGMKISDEFFNETFGDIVGKSNYMIAAMLLHPKSRGYLKLKDKNPYHWPKLYYDYFSNPRDLATMVEAIKYINKMSKTKAFQKLGSTPHEKHFPTCRQYKYGTDEYWECALRTLSSTFHHQIGSCKMGPLSDPESVVDHQLKVHGINKLRVVDSSIIPKPPSGHTNAPAVMIGEKASDMIKKTWT